MNWDSWSDFFAMGGYALYVWGSVLMTVVLIAGEVMAVYMRRKAVMKQHARWVRSNRRGSNENTA